MWGGLTKWRGSGSLVALRARAQALGCEQMPRAPRFTHARAVHHVTLYRSSIIEQSSDFLRCMAYVDLNPVRAGLAASARDYPWAGHGALSAQDASVLDVHDLYLPLGRDAEAGHRA